MASPAAVDPGRRRVGARCRSALRQRRNSGPDAAAAWARLRVPEPARAPGAGRDAHWAASARWRFRRPGATSGSAPIRVAICRRRAATPERRKQYRYHPMWTASRDETKYGRMEVFGRALPALRRQVARDLRQPALSRERVLATVVTLLEKTLIRVGNDEYARANRSFGLTTLENRHVRVRGARVHFKFRAKSGVLQVVELEDAALARSVKRCQDLPGQELFQYLDPRRRSPERGLLRRQRVRAGRDGTGLHGQGLPHVGGHGAGGLRARPPRTGLVGHRAQAAGRARSWSASPRGWATLPPSAGAATSTPEWSTPTWRARSWTAARRDSGSRA